MTQKMVMGVSGDAGSFSEAAALVYGKKQKIDLTLDYLIDMEGVLTAIEIGKVDRGIFPVVNVRGGLVRMAFEAMSQHQFKFIDELWFDVCQCLLVKPGIPIRQINKIVSHPQAFAQCKLYIQKELNKAELIEWQDTAQAARMLSQDQWPATNAVIAPERAAEIYGLEVVAKNIQDDHPNFTAFAIVKRFQEK